MTERRFRIAVFPGDGIGEEITRPCTALLEAAARKAGGFTLEFCGKPHAGQMFVALPLSADGQRVDAIITVHSYHIFEAPVAPLVLNRASQG